MWTAEKTCSHLWVYLDWWWIGWTTVAVKSGGPAQESWHRSTRADEEWYITACGHLCGWLCSYFIVSCGGCRIQRFVVEMKHLAWPGIYDFTEETFTLKTLRQNKTLDNWNVASFVFPTLFSLDSIQFDYFLFCYDRNLVSVNPFFSLIE